MKILRVLIAANLLLLTALAGWGQSREQIENRLVDAVQSYTNGNDARAELLLKSILEKDPSNDAAWYYLGMTQARQGRMEESGKSLEKAVALDPDNFWYMDRLALLYRSRGETEKVIKTYEEMLARHPKKTDICFDLLSLYAGTHQFDKALETLDSIEGEIGPGEKIATMRYEIYRYMGKEDLAIASLEEYNKKFSSAEVSSIIGDYYMADYQDSVALAAYEEALSLDSYYTPALLGKSEVYRIRRDYPAYFETLGQFIGNEETPVEAKGMYLTNINRQLDPSFLRNHKGEFDKIYDLALQKHPADSAILAPAGIYYYSTGRKETAKETLRRCADLYPDSKSQSITFLQMLYYEGELEEVRDLSDDLMKRFPDEVVFYEFNNSARYSLKDYEGIIANAENRIKAHPADTSVTIPAYAMIGDMYHSLGNEKKSFKAYEKVLKLNPDYVPVLNNYAYYLSMSGRSLNKACAMSRKTITAEPDNPTYLDTFGWILHLQGKDLEAKAMFKHAMLYGGKDSAVILDHYAEVLYALKEYDLAQFYWNLAISKNDGELKNLEKKVKHRMEAIK